MENRPALFNSITTDYLPLRSGDIVSKAAVQCLCNTTTYVSLRNVM